MPLAKKNNIQYILLFFAALLIPAIAWLAAQDVKLGVMVIAGILGLAMVVICFSFPTRGFYIAFTVSILIRMVERMSGTMLSVGTAIDAMVYASLLGAFVKRKGPDYVKVDYLRDPLLILQYLLIIFLFIQVANPNMYSILGWSTFTKVTIRYLAVLLLTLMVFNSMEDVRKFFKFWLALSTFTAFYGCLQGVFGLMPFEKTFIANTSSLTVVAHGLTRAFSTMSDPAVFGLLMSCGTIICLILLTAGLKVVSFKKKVLLAVSAVLHLLALGYSGTRTGYVVLPMGLLIFVIANLHNRNTIIAAMVFAFLGLVVIFGPFHNNATIIRVRTAFVGTKDASLDVRDVNRHRIQPYIYAHPLGGGVFTSAAEGEAFNPGHPLAGFPPDSGYMRTLLEQGYIALFLLCCFLFTMMQYATANYFRASNELDKLLLISIASVMFAIVIGQIAQEAAGLMESAFFLNALVGISIKVKYILKKQKIT
jgi:hypothetical protein